MTAASPLPFASDAEALGFFHSLSPSTIRLGLERMVDALEVLGRPDARYAIVQVAGTNGKGSTCAMVASCLRAAGLRVGLYTSPHLERVNERFVIDGSPLDDSVLARGIQSLVGQMPSLRNRPCPLTYFEVGTLLALWAFADAAVDVAVLEVGLGGRLDATTATQPVVTGITPVSFDHQEVLGDTLEKIAAEKAGILKAGVPLVCAEQAPAAQTVIDARAAVLGVPVWQASRDFRLRLMDEGKPGRFRYEGPSLRLDGVTIPLAGAHQVQNAATALAIVERLASLHPRFAEAATPDALRHGLAMAKWPGRFERVALRPTVILDGAHNAAGGEALAQTLKERFPGAKLQLVFGVLADKARGALLGALGPLVEAVHLTPLPSPRSLPPELYVDEVRTFCPRVFVYGGADDALSGARRSAGEEGVVICAGSLVLVGVLKAALASEAASKVAGRQISP